MARTRTSHASSSSRRQTKRHRAALTQLRKRKQQLEALVPTMKRNRAAQFLVSEAAESKQAASATPASETRTSRRAAARRETQRNHVDPILEAKRKQSAPSMRVKRTTIPAPVVQSYLNTQQETPPRVEDQRQRTVLRLRRNACRFRQTHRLALTTLALLCSSITVRLVLSEEVLHDRERNPTRLCERRSLNMVGR